MIETTFKKIEEAIAEHRKAGVNDDDKKTHDEADKIMLHAMAALEASRQNNESAVNAALYDIMYYGKRIRGRHNHPVKI